MNLIYVQGEPRDGGLDWTSVTFSSTFFFFLSELFPSFSFAQTSKKFYKVTG